jgi:hypothetical protein
MADNKPKSFREALAEAKAAAAAKHAEYEAKKPPKAAAKAEPAPADALPETGQVSRTYEGQDARDKGVAGMLATGWRVVTETSYQPRAGVGRVLALGVLAAAIKPKVKFIVTFER